MIIESTRAALSLSIQSPHNDVLHAAVALLVNAVMDDARNSDGALMQQALHIRHAARAELEAEPTPLEVLFGGGSGGIAPDLAELMDEVAEMGGGGDMFGTGGGGEVMSAVVFSEKSMLTETLKKALESLETWLPQGDQSKWHAMVQQPGDLETWKATRGLLSPLPLSLPKPEPLTFSVVSIRFVGDALRG